jgi:hypothetical protein
MKRGGPGTAPPGAPVSVIAMGSRRIDALLTDNNGDPMLFEWTVDGGWQPAVTVPIAKFPPGAPITLISHTPGDTMEIGGIADDGYEWGTWCDQGCSGTWRPGSRFTDSVKFLPGTVLTVLSRGTNYEEIIVVDGTGQVWRAWWTFDSGWGHPADGYVPFGVFSSAGMLPPGAMIATNLRSSALINLIAVDKDGAILGEWLEGGLWHPAEVPWESRTQLRWNEWAVDKASPNSVAAMLGNVGTIGDLDLFWIKTSRSLELWTARAARDGVWNNPSRIDGAP